jgi:hypothetical protein
MENQPLLYVDALNLFNFVARDGDEWTLFGKKRRDIKSFFDAASRSGWKVKAFIDAGTGDVQDSNEAMEKWKSRRVVEVEKGRKAVPQGSNVLLGDVFRSYGCDVVYSVRFDNDDTLAFMAERDGADVLSQDYDFYRYNDRNFVVYFDYDTKGGKLSLFKREVSKEIPKLGVLKRDLLPIADSDCQDIDPGIVSLRKNLYVRGCPCPLVRLIGNAHHQARPLRQALYARLGKDLVREIYPSWNIEAAEIEWIDENVASLADEALFDTDPIQLVASYYGNEVRPKGVCNGDWYNHKFACHAIVHELWLIGQNPRKNSGKLLEIMEEYEKNNSRRGPKMQRSIASTNQQQGVSKVIVTSNSAGVNPLPTCNKDLSELGFVFYSFPNREGGIYHCTPCGGAKGPICTTEESCRKHYRMKHL